MKITYRPIGIIHSPFKEPKGTPIQPNAAKDIEGMVEVFTQYEKGLKDIEGFSHIILIYHFHLSKAYSLEVKPYMDNKLHGLFATRAPARPNPIGLSVVRLTKVERNNLYIKDVDIVDGTPLLDIKSFVPEFNAEDIIKKGWLEKNIRKLPESKDDGRFVK
jgi:tRNA-Thr(GGU) m(6)t(6)A37 methyltransferase TsaA